MEVSVVPVRHKYYTVQLKVSDEQNPIVHTLPQVSVYFTSLEEAIFRGGCGLDVAFSSSNSPTLSTLVFYLCCIYLFDLIYALSGIWSCVQYQADLCSNICV